MATTVTWTQDADSNYEVSSVEHLKQIMHEGVLTNGSRGLPKIRGDSFVLDGQKVTVVEY